MHPKFWKFPGAAYREQATGAEGGGSAGGSGPLDTQSAAAAFEARLSDEPAPAAAAAPAAPASTGEAQAAAPEGEREDQAAERLALEQANGDGGAAADGAAAPQVFTIKVDGKDVALTADQVAEAYKGQARAAEAQQQTQAAAAARQAANAETAQARAQRDEYASKLEAFSGQGNFELNSLRAQLTEELLHADPVAYLATQRAIEQRQAQLAQVDQELQKITGQRQGEQAEALRNHITQQQEQLLSKLPEWKDPAKAKAGAESVKAYLAAQGFAPEEMGFTDHRAIVLANKAMQYDALMERARGAVKKVASAPPKVERPGNAETGPKPGDGRTTAMKQLKQSGSVDAAAAAFMQF